MLNVKKQIYESINPIFHISIKAFLKQQHLWKIIAQISIGLMNI
jgi:hypothetical protein